MKIALPVILGALVVGTAARVLSGTPILQTDLAAAANAGPAVAEGTPEAAVVAFYAALAAGDYGRAWDLSVEPRWPDAAAARYADPVRASSDPVGWTARADFVTRSSDDIGDGLRLNGVRAERMATPPDTAEARAAVALSGARPCGVHASGQMLGACLIYRWDRDLAVADIGGRYKVVLPGTKLAKSFYHQAWFANLTKMASLRAAGK